MNTKLKQCKTDEHKKNGLTYKRYYPWLVVLMSCLFLFYKYVDQVFPSVMTGELMQHFNLHATGLSSMVAVFFPTYLVMQLLAGLLYDRYCARKLGAVALGLLAVSLFAFSHANTLWEAYLFRATMGVGAGFATVSYLKLAAVWFNDRHYAFVAGFLATAASMGGMVAQAPLAYSVERLGWQQTLFLCSLLGVVIAVVYWMLVRTKSTSNNNALNTNHTKVNLNGFKKLLKNKKVWLLALYSGLAWAPMAVFSGLWGDSFLMTAFHTSKLQAASLVSMSFFGLAVGGPLFGWLANYWNNLYKVMFLGLLLSLSGLLFVLFDPTNHEWLLSCALFLFGFGTGAFMVGFALGKRWSGVALAATLVALVNTGDAVFSTFTEPCVGRLMDFFWHGKLVSHMPVYSAQTYKYALLVLPVYLALAYVVLLLIKRMDLASNNK